MTAIVSARPAGDAVAAHLPAKAPAAHASVSLAVVTPVHDRRETTLAFLESLFSTDAAGVALSVFVVDDGSTDGTADAIRARHPGVVLVPGDGSLWYTAGTNRGVAAALETDPDYVLACNDDLLFDAACLRQLLACAIDHPRTVVAPLLSPVGDARRVVLAAPAWRVAAGGWHHAEDRTVDEAPARPFLVESVAGNCLLVPAAAYRECGLMDEEHLPHHGDAEFPSRLRRAGWRLAIAPSARALSQPPRRWPRPAELSTREKWRHLVSDRRSGLNLRTRLFTNRRVAPTAASGAAASAVLLLRHALRAAGVKRAWPPRTRLPRLSELPLLPAAGDAPPVDVILSWPYVEWGGVQTYLVGVVRSGGARVRARAIVPSGTPSTLRTLLAEAGIAVETVDARVDLGVGGGIGERLRRRIRNLWARTQILRRLLSPDTRGAVLHLDEPLIPAFPFLFALSLRRPVVVTIHTPLAPPGRTARGLLHVLQARLLSHRLRLLAESATAKKSLRPWVGRRAVERIAVSPGAVDGAAAARALEEVRATSEDGRADPLVVVSGRFIDRKGRWDLLEAARLLHARGVSLRVAWVSPEAPTAAETARIAELADADLFRIVTPAEIGGTREDLLRFVAGASVFVQPSREEGLPLALAEALALGRPCVATAVGAMPEVVLHERTGLLVPPADPVALAEALARLLGDPLLRERLGAAGARLARRLDFSRASIATIRAWEEAAREP